MHSGLRHLGLCSLKLPTQGNRNRPWTNAEGVSVDKSVKNGITGKARDTT